MNIKIIYITANIILSKIINCTLFIKYIKVFINKFQNFLFKNFFFFNNNYRKIKKDYDMAK